MASAKDFALGLIGGIIAGAGAYVVGQEIYERLHKSTAQTAKVVPQVQVAQPEEIVVPIKIKPQIQLSAEPITVSIPLKAQFYAMEALNANIPVYLQLQPQIRLTQINPVTAPIPVYLQPQASVSTPSPVKLPIPIYLTSQL